MTFDKTLHARFFSVGALSRSLPAGLLKFAAASVPAVISAQGAGASELPTTWTPAHEPEDHFLNYSSTIPDESFEAIFRERQASEL
ncbi:MAG: hypothetical protein KGS72_11515 [Cyanobacteria bacterium REEB67]|nr:hypothetical protein [Cyanobacteria bacterium REEB67]